MQIRPEQLAAHLQKKLAPIYLVTGDESLLVEEAATAIRASARAAGYDTREVLEVDRSFDWYSLHEAKGTLSLFADKRIIELRMPAARPGDAGGKALRAYVEDIPEDTLLLIICGKLDKSQRQSKWVQALTAAGVQIPIWPVDEKHLPDWIRGRMQSKGLQPDAEAVALLAQRVEGNLLACAQEIDKLELLTSGGKVDREAVLQAVGDSARYGVFGLVDSALAGSGRRCQRILDGLRAEGVDPNPIVGGLAWEIRKMIPIAGFIATGQAVPAALARFKVWDSRKAFVGQALQRNSLGDWRKCLRRCARIDRIIKGRAPGNPWDELLQLSLQIAGKAPPLRDLKDG